MQKLQQYVRCAEQIICESVDGGTRDQSFKAFAVVGLLCDPKADK